MKCNQCNFDSPPEMLYCGLCGSRLRQHCPQCQFANPLNYRYCGLCGLPLTKNHVVPPARSIPTSSGPPAPIVTTRRTAQVPTVLAGSRRPVTVILTDVAGSTELLARLGSEGWVEIMNHALQLLEAEVYRYGGEVDQFRGDGLVAFFGAKAASEDDPERAVLTGLAMQESLQAYAQKLARERDIELQLRVGINTGEVIVASIGATHQHQEDTAMGEAVALAARMEQAAVPGTVLVSENTYRLAATHFEWEILGELQVKGISQPVAVYRPLNYIGRGPHRSQTFGLSSPLVGREGEFQTLVHRLQDLDAGRGAIVMVTGDKGVGKSYLIKKVRQHIASELPEINWLNGRCRSYDQSWPYAMWLSLLRDWLCSFEDISDAELQERLREQAAALWPDNADEYTPFLAMLLGLPLTAAHEERVKHLDGEGLRQQFFLTLRAWVEAMAGERPLVLVFADVHWVDATSLAVLEFCLPLVEQLPLLWIVVFRPQRNSAVWHLPYRLETDYPHRVTTMLLPLLTAEQSGEVIDQLIGADVLPAETWALVINKAEGNPYYIEELLLSLIEQDVLVQDVWSGEWRATRAVASLDLPDTVQSLLLARIDSLPLEARRVLQMTAVIGPIFWFDVLQSIATNEMNLPEQLTLLQKAQFILERGQVADLGMEYAFKSKLIRDVAYDSILNSQRIKYHKQVGDCLEQKIGDEVPPQYFGMLAYHYRQAEEPGKELFYHQLAAQQARKVYANEEALSRYSRILELLDKLETKTADASRLYTIHSQRFEVLNQRRELHLTMGNFEAARSDAQALLPLARQHLSDDPVWLIDALQQQPGVADWISQEELQAGLPLAEEALALSRQIGDQERELQCLIAIALQQLDLDDALALNFAEQALSLARQLGNAYYEARILINMSGIYNWSNRPERSEAYLKAALPLFQTLDDKIAESELLGQIAIHFERQGDYFRLLTEYHQKQLQISRDIGHKPLESEALQLCGQVQGIYLGEHETGLTLLEESLRLQQNYPGERFSWLRMVQIYVDQGQYQAAREALEQAYQVRVAELHEIAHVGAYLASAMLHNSLDGEANMYRALEDVTRVEKIVAERRHITRQFEMAAACEAARAHLNLAGQVSVSETAEKAARHQQALAASQKALAIYERFGFTQVVECVSEKIFFHHSQTLAANGRQSEAAQFLERAYAEMMRKHDLLPADSPFRESFLENIPLHRQIHSAYQARLPGEFATGL